MAYALTSPASGEPWLVSDPVDFSSAAARLAEGRGPVAVDTERASGFRYGERAFLVQLRRRGTGTILIDPEELRPAVTQAFAPVLGELDWVIHAAPSDLPSLSLLGLHPASLFDTELAGRLAGFERVNLAAMTEEVLGVELAKGHGAEDWSTRPLPADWINYAALDVELLIELQEAMSELLDASGKLEIAEEEFAHIRLTHLAAPAEPTWRDTKGVGTLQRGEQLAVAKHLWEVREHIARTDDRAVSRVLQTKLLVDMARQLPSSPSDLRRVNGGERLRGARAKFWLAEVAAARSSDRSTWPKRERNGNSTPSRASWPTVDPASWEVLTLVKEDLAEVSQDVAIPVENLLRPALLRDVVWHAAGEQSLQGPDAVRGFLAEQQARAWQIDVVSPILAERL